MKGGSGQWSARCPAHDDRRSSLSVSIGEGGRVLLKCHAGCTAEEIVTALGLSMKDLFVDKPPERPRVVAAYDYRDDAGNLLAQKLRYSDKRFSWRRPVGGGKWEYNRKGVPPRLYIAGDLGGLVHICEGEKDVDTFHAQIGGCAVSGADGAGPGKWRKEYTEQLRDRPVVILCDNDDVGRAYAQETAAALHGAAKSVRVVDLARCWPEIPEHGDISDMLAAKGPEETARLLAELEKRTPVWEPGPGGGFDGFGGFERQAQNENNFCEFCYFCGSDLSKSPVFPVEEFSRELRNFSVWSGSSLQTAVDMPSVSALAMVSLCAQRKFNVHPIARHYEPVNLYVAVVAKPSERKSPTISLAAAPIYRYQREENERRRPLVEEYQDRRDMLQRRIESMKRANGGKKAKGEAQNMMEDIALLRRELEDLEKEPVNYISLTADDITMEALTSKMMANGEKMALISSEGNIFNVLSGLYTGGTVNVDLILKAWSGDHVEVDRKGRPPEVLMNPVLTILLMVQPRVLEAVMSNVEFAGRGLNARFLYAIPVSTVGTRVFDAPDIPREVIDDYYDLLSRILAIPDTGEPRTIELTEDARGELRKIHDEIEPRLIADLEPMGDWAGKYEGTVVRIAGLLHVCDHIEKAAEVLMPGETIRRAAKIGEYFLAHAKIAYQLSGQMEDQPTKDAKYILKRLDSTGKTEISKRDLFDLCKGRVGMEAAEKMEPGLEVLVKRGYIKIEKALKSQKSQKSQNRGRPSLMIYVNPIYTQMKKEEKL